MCLNHEALVRIEQLHEKRDVADRVRDQSPVGKPSQPLALNLHDTVEGRCGGGQPIFRAVGPIRAIGGTAGEGVDPSAAEICAADAIVLKLRDHLSPFLSMSKMPALPSRRSAPSFHSAADASSVNDPATVHPDAIAGFEECGLDELFTRITATVPSANGCSETVTSRAPSSTRSFFGHAVA